MCVPRRARLLARPGEGDRPLLQDLGGWALLCRDELLGGWGDRRSERGLLGGWGRRSGISLGERGLGGG